MWVISCRTCSVERSTPNGGVPHPRGVTWGVRCRRPGGLPAAPSGRQAGMPRACAAPSARRDSLPSPASDLAAHRGPGDPWVSRTAEGTRSRSPAPQSTAEGTTVATATATTTAKKAATSKSTSDYSAHHLQVLEGLGGGAQAPRHVHRLHRQPRPHALPVGDHRQRCRRGTCRRVRPHRGGPLPGRLGRGARQRPRHPGGHRAAHRPDGRGGRLHQAARRRQVRRWLLHRLRRTPRRGRVGRQRAVVAPRRRGRPRGQDLRHELSPRRARLLPRRRDGGEGPDHEFTPYERSSELAVVGKAKRGVTGTRVRYWADHQIFLKDAAFDYDQLAARARQTSFLVPGLTLLIRDERRVAGTPGEEGPTRRPSSTTAASASSPSSSPPTQPSRMSGGCRARGRSPRRCRCSTRRAT